MIVPNIRSTRTSHSIQQRCLLSTLSNVFQYFYRKFWKYSYYHYYRINLNFLRCTYLYTNISISFLALRKFMWAKARLAVYRNCVYSQLHICLSLLFIYRILTTTASVHINSLTVQSYKSVRMQHLSPSFQSALMTSIKWTFLTTED